MITKPHQPLAAARHTPNPVRLQLLKTPHDNTTTPRDNTRQHNDNIQVITTRTGQKLVRSLSCQQLLASNDTATYIPNHGLL